MAVASNKRSPNLSVGSELPILDKLSENGDQGKRGEGGLVDEGANEKGRGNVRENGGKNSNGGPPEVQHKGDISREGSRLPNREERNEGLHIDNRSIPSLPPPGSSASSLPPPSASSLPPPSASPPPSPLPSLPPSPPLSPLRSSVSPSDLPPSASITPTLTPVVTSTPESDSPPIARNFAEAVIQMTRLFLSSIYLCYIVLTIPLSFEIGGLDCGLSYSLTILLLYFSLATLRVLRYHRFVSTFLYYMQHLLLPSLLSLFLTIFTANSDDQNLPPTSFWSRFWWNVVIKGWKIFLINSTPLFTILEGFCSLLSIQAIGQVSQYLIRYRSDTWSIANLIVSSCILLTCVYFVVKIYVSPAIDLVNVGMVSASLLGSVFTCTILITIFGVSSGRASPLECSLLVAYIVKCSYELFPELSKSNFTSLFKFIMTEFKKIDSQANSLNKEFLKSVHEAFKSSGGGFVSLLSRKGSSVIAGSSAKRDQLLSLVYVKIKDFLVNVLWRFIAENLPRSFEPLWDFFKISMSNLTVPILIQLAYRICVFFAATKIIPILQPIQHHDSPLSTPTTTEPQLGKLTKTDSRQDRGGRVRSPMKNKNASTPSRLIYLYSPCIIIAVYTNLMIQYNDDLDKQNHFWNWVKMKLRGDLSIQTAAEIASDDVHSWQFWNWINIFSVLLLYLSELINHDPEDSSLADHWA